MIPRLMQVYSPPVSGQVYITNISAGVICLLSCVVEIVEISVQDNIETLLRYFFQYAAKIVFLDNYAKLSRFFMRAKSFYRSRNGI